MTEDLKTANENIHKKASERQHIMNRGPDNKPIEIGSNILLKNMYRAKQNARIGSLGSCPNIRIYGVYPVEECGVALYMNVSSGRYSGHFAHYE
jgi:hypothetical protein